MLNLLYCSLAGMVFCAASLLVIHIITAPHCRAQEARQRAHEESLKQFIYTDQAPVTPIEDGTFVYVSSQYMWKKDEKYWECTRPERLVLDSPLESDEVVTKIIEGVVKTKTVVVGPFVTWEAVTAHETHPSLCPTVEFAEEYASSIGQQAYNTYYP